jgi:NADH-quinone oxidoreductase subunit C
MTTPQALDPAVAVKNAFADALMDVVNFRGETTLVVVPEKILAVAQYLRDTPGLIYNYLSDISDVDYYPDYNRPGRYGLSYHLLSMLYSRRLRLKVYLQEDDPTVDSVIPVWPAANWLEREIHDLMGISFKGNPDLRRLMLPDDWFGHPHRRDYPLGYEQVMFSFNVEEILKHKPKGSEYGSE